MDITTTEKLAIDTVPQSHIVSAQNLEPTNMQIIDLEGDEEYAQDKDSKGYKCCNALLPENLQSRAIENADRHESYNRWIYLGIPAPGLKVIENRTGSPICVDMGRGNILQIDKLQAVTYIDGYFCGVKHKNIWYRIILSYEDCEDWTTCNYLSKNLAPEILSADRAQILFYWDNVGDDSVLSLKYEGKIIMLDSEELSLVNSQLET